MVLLQLHTDIVVARCAGSTVTIAPGALMFLTDAIRVPLLHEIGNSTMIG